MYAITGSAVPASYGGPMATESKDVAMFLAIYWTQSRNTSSRWEGQEYVIRPQDGGEPLIRVYPL